MLDVFQVNVTFLQVSIVEEIISFSALDNVKDLTCVSLLSVCFDNIIMKLHCDKQVSRFVNITNRYRIVCTIQMKKCTKK